MEEREEEMSLFRSCQEISQADFRFLEECLAEKEESEGITDILLERLVMKGWEIYQGGRRNDVEILKLSNCHTELRVPVALQPQSAP